MAATASENILGVGLYTVEEVARYARVSKNLVNRWFFGTREGEATVARCVIAITCQRGV